MPTHPSRWLIPTEHWNGEIVEHISVGIANFLSQSIEISGWNLRRKLKELFGNGQSSDGCVPTGTRNFKVGLQISTKNIVYIDINDLETLFTYAAAASCSNPLSCYTVLIWRSVL